MSFNKIQIQESKLPHARFDKTKAHFSTANWGEVSPSIVTTLATPDQKVSFNSSKLARLAPLVSPTYGKIRLKEYFQFVPWRTIFRGCNSFLAQVQRLPDAGKNMSRVSQLPRIETNILMYYLCCRNNSHVQFYSREGEDVTTNKWNLGGSFSLSTLNALFPNWSNSAFALSDFENIVQSEYSTNEFSFSPDVADFRCTVHTTQDITLCIKLTQRGLRFQKVLYGSGYPISFQPNSFKSVLHLWATYKAYFDIFKIDAYMNWEETACYSLIRYYDTNNPSSSNDASFANFATNAQLKQMWFSFFDELCDMYYTANADNVSSHLPLNWNLNAAELQTLNGLVELNGITNIDPSATSSVPSIYNENFSSLLNALNPRDAEGVFNQVSDEFIKKAYYYCQRKTAIGNNISNLLKAKGLGGYVDILDSGFLGKSETPITVSEVISTSDTQLRSLGDYAGQASKFDRSDQYFIHNKEIGVLVGLYTVVPESHLVNSPDMSLDCCTPQTWYNPILDGLGYEGIARESVGHIDANYHMVPNSKEGSLKSVFGLQPRFQSFKVSHDTMSGLFACRSSWDPFDTFHLAKLIKCHETEVQLNGTVAANGSFMDNVVLAPTIEQTFPNAGLSWRYPAKYDLIGHYNRIFYADNGAGSSARSTVENDKKYPVDNFMLFFEFNVSVSAPMLPVSKSFETIECEAEKTNTFTINK